MLLAGLAVFAWLAHSAYRSLSLENEAREAASRAGPLVQGMRMPSGLTLQSLDAKATPLDDYRGKVVLLNFWAGWCGPCLQEMPALYELQKSLGPKGFVVLGVNMDDSTQSGLRILKNAAGEAPFPIFHGMGSLIADKFSLEGLPFTVVLDKDFHIVYAQAGEVNWNAGKARSLIEALL